MKVSLVATVWPLQAVRWRGGVLRVYSLAVSGFQGARSGMGEAAAESFLAVSSAPARPPL